MGGCFLKLSSRLSRIKCKGHVDGTTFKLVGVGVRKMRMAQKGTYGEHKKTIESYDPLGILQPYDFYN